MMIPKRISQFLWLSRYHRMPYREQIKAQHPRLWHLTSNRSNRLSRNSWNNSRLSRIRLRKQLMRWNFLLTPIVLLPCVFQISALLKTLWYLQKSRIKWRSRKLKSRQVYHIWKSWKEIGNPDNLGLIEDKTPCRCWIRSLPPRKQRSNKIMRHKMKTRLLLNLLNLIKMRKTELTY